MKFLESIKHIYENTSEKILVTDTELNVLWQNYDCLSDFLLLDELKALKSQVINQSTVLRCTDSYTVKVLPLLEDDELSGYMLTFYDPEEIEALYDKSIHLKYKKNTLGNQRIALMPIVNTLENYNSQGKEIPSDFFDEAKAQVLKLLSSSVNSQEMSKYYSGEILTELLNVSQCLEETAELFKSRFCDDKCSFKYEVQSGLFLNMNYECMQNAVLNLLVNGYMYNDSGEKRLELRAYVEGDELFIEVWDNGSADLQRLENAMIPYKGFEKFGHREALGLALVNKFAGHFGGRFVFAQKDGEGLTARISLNYEIKEKPQRFRLRRVPMVIGEFEPASCIMAKGLLE